MISDSCMPVMNDFGSSTHNEVSTESCASPCIYIVSEFLIQRGTNELVDGFNYDSHMYVILLIELFRKKKISKTSRWFEADANCAHVKHDKIFHVLEKKNVKACARTFSKSRIKK